MKLTTRLKKYARQLDSWLGQFPAISSRDAKLNTRSRGQIIGPTTRMPAKGGGGFSTFDVEELNTRNRRRAYRSTAAMLISYRAGNFAKHMKKLKVQRVKEDGDFEDVEFRHPWGVLLRRPNPHKAAGKFWRLHFKLLDYAGEAVYFVKRGRVDLGLGLTASLPIALYIVYPGMGKVRPIYGPVGEITGWNFWRADGQQFQYPHDTFVRIYRDHPDNPEQAESLLQRQYDHVRAKQLADKFANTQNENLGRPDVMLEIDESMDEEEMEELSALFDEKFTVQPGKKKSTPVAAGGLKIKEIELTNRDRQFNESRLFEEDQHFITSMVPKGQFTDSANRANTEGTFRSFCMNVVEPAVTDTVEQIEHAFERLFGSEPGALRIQVPDDIVPQDPEQVARVDKMYVEMGVCTINEIRAKQGKEGVDGGDVPRAVATLTPLDEEPIPMEF